MRRIDPHTHCRDGKEVKKGDIRKVSESARAQGIGHICDMPSIDRPILWEKDVIARLKLAAKRRPVVGYSFYLSLSADEQQIAEAVRLADKYPEILGLKLYPPLNEKKNIFMTLARLNYSGVLAVHAEKASLFKPHLFNPKKPWTHGLARPKEAEIESIKEQIRFALETNFPGTLYICHVTLPESVELVWQAKKHLDIYSEVTPHHLLLDEVCMKQGGSLLLKVNPPLREHAAVRGLLMAVRRGLVDCIGTDYAPHELEKKIYPPYLSGIADYRLYGELLDFLSELGMTEEEIDKMTYWNIKKVFGKKLEGV